MSGFLVIEYSVQGFEIVAIAPTKEEAFIAAARRFKAKVDYESSDGGKFLKAIIGDTPKSEVRVLICGLSSLDEIDTEKI